MIKVSGVFIILFWRGIQRISGVIPAKSSSCIEKQERYLLSLTISISVSFYILVLILDKFVPGTYLYLSTVLTVSLLDVSTVLLDACDFSVLLTVSIFFLK